jgi:dihydrofolate synthase/folylpolyglutamate synthase
VVLEVGLGGRLDAVNVVDADVAVVVSVGLDHMEFLGPDIESIGREKAGIFRAGRPAICGMREPPQSVMEVARSVGAVLQVRGRDFEGSAGADGGWNYRDGYGELAGLPRPALQGEVQIGNAATALAALRGLSSRLPLRREAFERGLAGVQLPGRFQRVPAAGGFEWVLDVAHNPDAAAVLAANLARHPVPGRTLAVCGMLADKDVPAVLGVLKDSADRWFGATIDGPRGLRDTDLAAHAASVGITMMPGGTVREAMQAAARAARAGDRVVVFGSFHTVGPALSCV